VSAPATTPDPSAAEPDKGARGKQAKVAPVAPSVTVLDKPVSGIAPPARVRRRHVLLLLSFVVCVLLPAAISFFYLYFVAADE
jgi:capsular polysaccharide transport system permease protein